MIISRKHEYNTITASPENTTAETAASAFSYYSKPQRPTIDVDKEQQCFFDNSLSITEMVWSYNYYGIAVFEPGYFGQSNGYAGSGGGSGGGGGYKVSTGAPAISTSGGMR